jgi:hypothetical protein
MRSAIVRMTMEYGRLEKLFARPIADALVSNSQFRAWLLSRTKFAEFATTACLLDQEMLAKRSKGAKSWWASHFTEMCRCAGCRGQETDLLAIFETEEAFRFALHIEVKHPGDKFQMGGTQAASYPIRAACWAGKAPSRVLRHSAATAVLLYSSDKAKEYESHLPHFESRITFQEILRAFPSFAISS